MSINSLSSLLLAVILAAGVVGCKKKMDRVTPLPGYGGSSKIGDAQPNPLDRGGTVIDGGTPAQPPVTSVDPYAVIPQTGARSIEGRPQDREKFKSFVVLFDFDRANVKASEAAKVQEVAAKFKSEDAATDLLIEGHCDERGTEEYNRSLGERRALALRELLVASGVSPERVHTLSFGKDKPADPGHDETAHARNRRGEFILVLPK